MTFIQMDTSNPIPFCPLPEPCESGKKGLCTRYDCLIPVKCEECGWQGLSKDAVHGYSSYPVNDGGDFDSEACDYCPVCGSENMEEVK